ncbi:MAG: hypothetical protein FWD21_00040 [Peptococcaceae bacterium]|nr:hypothetical protein [Peptococcaceae bacterium]
MKKPDTILDEVHTTRRKLYEETKDMTSSERVAYFNKRAEEVAEKYGFRIVPKKEQAG